MKKGKQNSTTLGIRWDGKIETPSPTPMPSVNRVSSRMKKAPSVQPLSPPEKTADPVYLTIHEIAFARKVSVGTVRTQDQAQSRSDVVR